MPTPSSSSTLKAEPYQSYHRWDFLQRLPDSFATDRLPPSGLFDVSRKARPGHGVKKRPSLPASREDTGCRTGQAYQEAVQGGQHLMDTQRCQNHGPVRLLVPLLEFNQVGKNARACESGRRKADAPRPNRDRSPEPPIAERSPHAGTWWRCAASCERRGHWWRAGDAYRPYPVTVGDWSVCPPFKLESSTVPSVIVTPEGIPERERRSDSEAG